MFICALNLLPDFMFTAHSVRKRERVGASLSVRTYVDVRVNVFYTETEQMCGYFGSVDMCVKVCVCFAC